MTAPPVIRPSRKGGWSIDRFSSPAVRPWVSVMMIEKIMVVAPTTAVPIRTGLAVALKVFPAPSFSSSRCLARSKLTSNPKSFLISATTPGMVSMTDSS